MAATLWYACPKKEIIMDFDQLLKAYSSSASSDTQATAAPPSSKRARYQSSSRVNVVREKRNWRTTTRPRLLVLVCAGPNSLHDGWIQPDETADITLCVVWYGMEEPEERLIQSAAKVMKKQGPKWVLVRAALKELVPNWREDFDMIWIPDDDIKFVRGDLSKMADIMLGFDLDLIQPCLTDKNITCAAYRPVVLPSRHRFATFHRTNCNVFIFM